MLINKQILGICHIISNKVLDLGNEDKLLMLIY